MTMHPGMLGVLSLIGLMVQALPVMAQTPAVSQAPQTYLDHKCLSDCISNGTPSHSCMMTCSYTDAVTAPASTSTTLQTAPSTAANPVPSAAFKPSSPSVDYRCLNQCTQGGYQHSLCTQRCTSTGGNNSTGTAH